MRLATAAMALLAAAGCSSDSPPSPQSPPETVVRTVRITPASLSLHRNQSGQLVAQGLDAAGQPVPDRPVSYRSTAPAIAAVSANGSVTALALGTTEIRAEIDGVSGTAAVAVVVQPVASIALTPPAATIAVGEQLRLTARLLNGAGRDVEPRPISWSSSNPGIATVDGTGLATGVAAGMAEISAAVEGRSSSTTVTVTSAQQPPSPPPPAPTPVTTGLDFPGNVNWPSRSPDVILVWRAGVSTAPPPWTASSQFTFIQRVRPRRQEGGYWAGLFYAQWATRWDPTSRYFGSHPYPSNAESANSSGWGPWYWELSISGADVFEDDPASPAHGLVTYDRDYVQVTTVSGNVVTFHWDWPNRDRVIATTVGPRYQQTPTDPAIIIGAVPWNAGHENYSGVIRGLQFYDTLLTQDQIDLELATPGSVRKPWYLNLNPTPTDVSDKSGNGHHPGWANGNRPGLWQAP